MIIFLHFAKRKPGYPSYDFLILNKQLMQIGAARYVDVDQATRDGRQRRPQLQRRHSQMSRPRHCKPTRSRETATALLAGADGRVNCIVLM